jgi:putative DNA primase/helicase
VRVDDGSGTKRIWQEHWDGLAWVKGIKGIKRADIPIYRYAEVKKIANNNELIFIVEGETCADALWDLGLAATCNIGGAKKWCNSDTHDLKGAQVVICPDRDVPGIEHATEIYKDFPQAQWLYAYPDSKSWDNLPKSSGLDVADWIESEKLNAQTLLNSLSPHARTREEVVCQKYDSSVDDYIPDTAPIAEQNFVQKAESALYGNGHWVSIGGQLYHWVGSHYELQSEAEEKRRIGNWLNTYSEKVKGVWVNNRAKSSNVAEVLNWVVSRTAVDPNKINPDGLNCSNGVLKINPDGSHSLVSHNSSYVYTYVGGKYDPGADPTDCDRLLECLEPAQREIFLRTAAAALNLKLVRSKLTGKGVKGLLCYGEGSNGKDTLRAVLAVVFGRGMTPKSLSDFKSYDGGRKFTLAGLEGAVCNWASENASNVSLDTLQSLKQFITGDPIDIERKGKDGYEYKPAAIFLANCNKLPSITGGTAAIDDRYGILSFKKTYKRGADPSKGELEADPRFKDDPDFILERIAPAMLNEMLERMPLLLTEGIDYKATREAMQEAQEESRHLWQFAREVGLEFEPEGKVYIGDLYKILESWYLENGWLTVDDSGKKNKKSWEAESPYDSPVKKSQDLYLRLRELFPKIERRVDTQERYGHKFIFGLKLVNSSQVSQGACLERVSSQGSSQGSKQVTCDDTCDETLAQRQPCYPCDDSSLFTEFLQWFSNQPQNEREKMLKILTKPQSAASATQELRSQNTQPEPSPQNESVTPEDAEKLRDIALIWWDEYYPEHQQILTTQMFGWQSPGSKYDVAVIADWLETQEDLVRERITYLINERSPEDG